jgi:hypothetical protein
VRQAETQVGAVVELSADAQAVVSPLARRANRLGDASGGDIWSQVKGQGFGAFEGAALRLEITRKAVTEGRVEGVLRWLGPHPEPALGPATARTDIIPFWRRVHMGDFIRRRL